MATMSGADPDLLDALAADLRQAAERLDGMQLGVSSRLTSTPWDGSDAGRFRTDWDGVHRRAFRAVTQSLRAAADQVVEHAADQRRTSASTGGLAAGAGGATGAGVGGAVGGAVGAGAGGGGGSQVPGSAPGSPLILDGDVSAEFLTASAEAPEVTFSLLTGEKNLGEDGEFTIAEVSAATSAQAALADIHAEGSADLGPAHAEAEGDLFAGAKGEAEAGVSLSSEGLKAGAGVNALVGATAAGSVAAGAFGQSVKAEGHVTYGLELTAEASAEISYEHVTVELEVGAALGLGAGGKIGLDLKPEEAVRHLGELWEELS